MLPVIIVSSHTVGLGVTRALGTMGVPVFSVYYDSRDMGHVSKYVKEAIKVPHPEHHEKQFIHQLIEFYDRTGKALLVPADDTSLVIVSKHKALLGNYFLIACTDYAITERFIDKKYTYALADQIGIPAPRTSLPASFEELEDFAGKMEYPCLVKPSQSHKYFEQFHHKLVKVDNFAELSAAYRQAAAAGLEVMIQEFIPGDDTLGVNYNSYFWDGQPLVEFTASKVRLSPPGFGIPSVVMSKEVREVLEPGRKILQGLGYYGYSCVEFKRDSRNGVYKLMEVNGRHNRSTLLAVQCGINFPWIEYCHLVCDVLPVAKVFRQGVYWIDEFQDADRYVKNMRSERVGLARYLSPYLRRHVFAVFDWRDIKPFCKRCMNIMKMMWRNTGVWWGITLKSEFKTIK